MKSYILFEDPSHFDLRPFTFTRPVWALRSGIFTFRERWEKVLGEKVAATAYDYLAPLFADPLPAGSCIWINGKLAPDEELLQMVRELDPGSYVAHEGELLLAHFSSKLLPPDFQGLLDVSQMEEMDLRKIESSWQGIALRRLTDIFERNAALIAYDFHLITRDRTSGRLNDPHTRVYGADNLFIEPGVETRAAIINAEDGLIYLGKDVQVSEGAIIKGTHAFGEKTVVAMGAKLRGDSSFGPYVKVGGEVTNSVIMGYSNKSHEGYLGNSVLGYWCNIGADSNTSNLKNNYTEVRLWNYPKERFLGTGSLFCGLMMGDHSKCGINTMFNSGTVTGVSANIFGAGYPRNFLPSFSWGGVGKVSTYSFSKALEVARIVMARRGLELDAQEAAILEHVFELTQPYRNWDK